MEQDEERRVGETLAGKYKLEALLGAGAMGAVYRATNVAIGRAVAIKVLRPEHGKNAEIVERFLREARAANIVRHPNVVVVLDIGRDDAGSPFIVQELLEGEDLSAYVARSGRLPVPSALDLLLPVVEAVEFAHARGVVHRDLKPENIFLAKQGSKLVPKPLDFGISHMKVPDKVRLTSSGSMMGTPAYMAPEQVRGQSDLSDARTDVWALGVILFEIIGGRLPFEGETIPAMFVAIATTDAPSLATVVPAVPDALAKVVERCLRRSPDDRYPTACELARDLRFIRSGKAIEDTHARAIPPPGIIPELDTKLGRGARAVEQAGPGFASQRTPVRSSPDIPAAPRAPSLHEIDPIPVTETPENEPEPRIEIDAPLRSNAAIPVASSSRMAAGAPISGPGYAATNPQAFGGPAPPRVVPSHGGPGVPATSDNSGLYGGIALALVAILATGAMMAVVHRPDGWDLRLWINPVFDGHGSPVQIGVGAVLALVGGGLVLATARADEKTKSSFVIGAGLLAGGVALALAGVNVVGSGQIAAGGLSLVPVGVALRVLGVAHPMWPDRKPASLGLGAAAALGFFAALELIMGAAQP